ncbi:hypothetical protein [Pseudoalteromonas fuliginea]|uniref:Sel1 repeat family protein n=1 Tax=Pseudoalteromonas fuliginea TaxID=1872678 RepID=A0ABQ6RE14_9GAMM|nr:hypothetical protein [Pseudoalteromonas fuliginea]KAA1150973.1 hypothetical protein EU509_17890 [Pseudoalteromonas fuliginea]KAA1165646.1 hypothetical protein EUZ79_17880 [Pseudoalteromonas fuliginea]
MKNNNMHKLGWVYLSIFLIVSLLLCTVGYFYNKASAPPTSAEQTSNYLTVLPQKTPEKAVNTDLLTNKKVANSALSSSEGKYQRVIMTRPQWKLQGEFREHFKRLQAAANDGDNEAKYIIATNLRYCLSAPIDDYALQAELEEISQYSDVGEAADRKIEKFDYCKGINSIERHQFYAYLEDAAKNGFVAAQESFVNLTAEFFMKSQGFSTLKRAEFIKKRDNFNKQKIVFLEYAAQHGSEKALISLSNVYYSQQLGEKSFAKSYALNRLIMEITDNNDIYNRYAWFEQRQYPQLSESELASANEIIEQWSAIINKNGTVYPHD